MIENTIKSIRFHLPESPIIIMADGVRPNVEFRRAQYENYLQRLADLLASMKYGNVCMPMFNTYTQQAQMMRRVLNADCDPRVSTLIETPYVLFCEHDGELVSTTNPRIHKQETLPEDCQIAWQDICDLLASGGANIVRFYAWDEVYSGHAHLMQGQMIQSTSRFIKTTQYSQWPHIARTDFYKKMLHDHFRPDEIRMIEIGMYGPVGAAPWEQYRVVIYAPEGNMRRFYHRNGRADETGKQDPVDW